MLKQYIILYFLLVISVLKSDAQVPKLLNFGSLNASGASIQSGSLIFDWNLGSVFTKTFSDDQFLLLTSGFLQSKEVEKIISPDIDSLLDLDKRNHLITLYPNPTNNFLFISNPLSEVKIIHLKMYNIKGELMKNFDAAFSTTSDNKMISLVNFASGTYVFSLQYIIAGKYLRTKFLRIIKL